MATQEDLEKRANQAMQPHLDEQALQTMRLHETQLRQARFMLLASSVVALIYLGFIASRVVNGRPLSALTYITLGIVIAAVANTARRYHSVKATRAAT